MAWASDPTNLAFVLAGLVGFAFLVLALKPRERLADETVAADEPIPATEPAIAAPPKPPEPPPPPPPPRVTAFEFLIKNGVEKWNAARQHGEFVDADFSDVGEAFQAQAEGSKIWGIPAAFHNSKPRLMLSGIDLAGANLAGCDLHYADLRRADLTEACLANARLESALMPNARLSDADLRGAHLDNAVLSNANLRGANLEGASVDGASFAWADMRGAKGNRKQLEKLADLGGARLAGASFDGAKARFQVAGRNLLSKKPMVWR
jgi:hypothetical protein